MKPQAGKHETFIKTWENFCQPGRRSLSKCRVGHRENMKPYEGKHETLMKKPGKTVCGPSLLTFCDRLAVRQASRVKSFIRQPVEKQSTWSCIAQFSLV